MADRLLVGLLIADVRSKLNGVNRHLCLLSSPFDYVELTADVKPISPPHVHPCTVLSLQPSIIHSRTVAYWCANCQQPYHAWSATSVAHDAEWGGQVARRNVNEWTATRDLLPAEWADDDISPGWLVVLSRSSQR